MSTAVLPQEKLNKLVEFLLDLADTHRDFLLEMFESEAPDFYNKLEKSLPALRDFHDWDPRLLQQLIRVIPFKTLAWAIYERDPALVQVFAENISHRGRTFLMEELQTVKAQRRRQLENGSLTPQRLKKISRKEKIYLLLQAQHLAAEWEAEHRD